MGLEGLMHHNGTMTRLLTFCFGLVFLLLLPALVQASGGRVSPWLDFREARIRLILASQPPAEGVVGAIEIQLAPGYKTYWRVVGDSGVPPNADFSGSTSYSGLALDFPFPKAFDDGAGGKAWGYTDHVMLPIRGQATGAGGKLAVKLDFAVCGTMCIPLNGELVLAPGLARPLAPEDAAVLSQFVKRVPVAASDPVRVLSRSGSAEAPVFTIRVAHPLDAPKLEAFAEADGFLETKSIAPHEPGHVAITLSGQPAPGRNGRFGPVRLTFGTPEVPREVMLNLDDGAAVP
jgi:DsbC/DsbD-like thiol-disulfide interchange protein